MRTHFTQQDAEAMASELVKAGIHPRVVRERLSQRGIHWEYQFLGQGRRERTRRLKQLGLKLCRCGNGTHSSKAGEPGLCEACLVAKWGSGVQPH